MARLMVGLSRTDRTGHVCKSPESRGGDRRRGGPVAIPRVLAAICPAAGRRGGRIGARGGRLRCGCFRRRAEPRRGAVAALARRIAGTGAGRDNGGDHCAASEAFGGSGCARGRRALYPRLFRHANDRQRHRRTRLAGLQTGGAHHLRGRHLCRCRLSDRAAAGRCGAVDCCGGCSAAGARSRPKARSRCRRSPARQASLAGSCGG